MASPKTSFLQWSKTFNEDNDPPVSHNNNSGSNSQSRILDIENAERAALTDHAEKLCASQKAHSHAVLERLGFSVQQDTLPSPQPTACPRRSPESSLHGKEAELIRKGRIPSPVSSLSSVDSHTPTELRAISKIGRFTPTPPPAATRRPSRIPPKDPAPRLKAAPPNRGGPCPVTPAVAPKAPAPCLKAAPPSRGEPCPVTSAVAPKAPVPPLTAAPLNKRGPRRGTKLHATKALESPPLCFKLFNSDDLKKKVDRLESVRALARHHPARLQTKLHEVCLVLEEEVQNLHPAVAWAAMDTIAELHADFGRAMDPEAERTGRALLLKFARPASAFTKQQANLALDALVEGCSPGRIINALLNTGLSHRCAAVRVSTAQHLHQLVDIMGEDQVMMAGKTFAKQFVTAVSKMAVDAVPEVRAHGREMLQALVHQKEFLVLWDKIVPEKDRHPLQKILQKTRR